MQSRSVFWEIFAKRPILTKKIWYFIPDFQPIKNTIIVFQPIHCLTSECNLKIFVYNNVSSQYYRVRTASHNWRDIGEITPHENEKDRTNSKQDIII